MPDREYGGECAEKFVSLLDILRVGWLLSIAVSARLYHTN